MALKQISEPLNCPIVSQTKYAFRCSNNEGKMNAPLGIRVTHVSIRSVVTAI